MSSLKIILADDHAAVRKSVRLLMECDIDIEVVAEVTNGLDAIRAVHAYQPDLLVLDIKMPQMTGLEVLQYLRNEKHRLGIIILSNHSDQLYVAAALRLGADAFVTKSAGAEALLEAIQRVRQRICGDRPEILVCPVEADTPRNGNLLLETRAELEQTRREWSEAS
jgi:two-component system nitrate/nitrite response regulator NarL